MSTGLLIVFEGIDGCGKGTQTALLQAALAREGRNDVVMFKQPGGTPLGNEMRNILFHTITTHNMASDTACLLFMASAVEGQLQVVRPALDAGKIVISDRWDAYSGIQFGKYALRPPASASVLACRADMELVTPDLVFFMHGDPAVFLDRAFARTAETHQSGKAWANIPTLTQIQDGYFNMFAELPWVNSVQADIDTPEGIFEEQIWPVVQKALHERYGTR